LARHRAQAFAQDAESAATAAGQRNATLERDALALQRAAQSSAAAHAQELREAMRAAGDAQEAALAADARAREACQKQADAEAAARAAVAAAAAKDNAVQHQVRPCFLATPRSFSPYAGRAL
jgi:hypothetical protein